MNSDRTQALRDKYQAELEAMDAKAEKLDEMNKAEYTSARNDFSQKLDHLGEAAEAQWDEAAANVEKTWDGLRAWWHGKGDDNEAAETGNVLDDVDDSQNHG